MTRIRSPRIHPVALVRMAPSRIRAPVKSDPNHGPFRIGREQAGSLEIPFGGITLNRRDIQGKGMVWWLLFAAGWTMFALWRSMVITLRQKGVWWRETFYPLEVLRLRQDR